MVTLAAPLIEKVPGANLRSLMRTRLKEITGLDTQQAEQLAQSTPREAPPAYDPGIDYDAIPDYTPDYSDFHQPEHYQPQQQWTPKPGGQQKKKWDGQAQGKKGKQWDRNGKRQEFHPAWVPTSVEPPTIIALRTLLHHPELARKVEETSHFAAEEHLYAQLLVALVEALQKKPELRSLQLIARWHGTEQGRLLRALAEKEWLIDADNLEQQFFDTITSLSARQRERSLEHLLRKARQSELSAEEKNQLRDLLSRNVPVQTPTSTGA